MINRKYGLCLMGLFAGFAVLAAADPQPLPSSVLNSSGVQLNTSVAVPSGNPAYPVTIPGLGSGGGFTATIDGVNTILWCVDAEEDIAPPTTYQGDLVRISDIGSTSTNYVRYGGVNGTYNKYTDKTGWQLPLSTDTTAQQRYEMAAYLTSLYPGVPAGPNPSNTLSDQELEAAIWEVMWNQSISPESSISYNKITTWNNTFSSADKTQVAQYISDAQTFVNNSANASFFDNYAVVSGGVNSNGNLSGSSGIQTYIVPLDSPSAVPEPKSVILLGTLLIGVLALASWTRRKRAGLTPLSGRC